MNILSNYLCKSKKNITCFDLTRFGINLNQCIKISNLNFTYCFKNKKTNYKCYKIYLSFKNNIQIIKYIKNLSYITLIKNSTNYKIWYVNTLLNIIYNKINGIIKLFNKKKNITDIKLILKNNIYYNQFYYTFYDKNIYIAKARFVYPVNYIKQNYRITPVLITTNYINTFFIYMF
jgi:hypothetical protein